MSEDSFREHDVEKEGSHDNQPKGMERWCEQILLLLVTGLVDRQDSTSLLMILVLVLTLRALAT